MGVQRVEKLLQQDNLRRNGGWCLNWAFGAGHGHIVNMLGSAGHRVTVPTAFGCSEKSAADDT